MKRASPFPFKNLYQYRIINIILKSEKTQFICIWHFNMGHWSCGKVIAGKIFKMRWALSWNVSRCLLLIELQNLPVAIQLFNKTTSKMKMYNIVESTSAVADQQICEAVKAFGYLVVNMLSFKCKRCKANIHSIF